MPTAQGAIYLLYVPIYCLSALVDGAYFWHTRLKNRICYFYLSLGCDTRIVEALLRSQARSVAIFHFVELLLSRGFTWNEDLVNLVFCGSRAGLHQVSVFIETPFHRRTYHPLATLNLAVIRDIVDFK
jgi:hypothetical protein